MTNKSNTRVTIDIPTIDHKKLKMLAAFQGKSMKEVFIELIEKGLETYSECSQDHTPNQITINALKKLNNKKDHQKAISLDDLFEQLKA